MIMTKKKKTVVHVPYASLNLIVDVSWDFALRHLWKNYSYDDETIALSKKYIRRYYREIPLEKFIELGSSCLNAFCDRIVLAEKYASHFTYCYFPNPAVWFDTNNPKGFRLTKKWYEHGKATNGKPIPKYVPPCTGVISILTDEENYYSKSA
jgi:hypothetical protein